MEAGGRIVHRGPLTLCCEVAYFNRHVSGGPSGRSL